MRWLFNFDIFSIYQWNRLAHAHLHGFPGFIFGILLLAALPLYIATTVIIYRTGKPLITIPIPKFLRPAPAPKVESATDTNADTETPPEPMETFPATMPPELRPAFIRARTHMAQTQTSVFNAYNIPGTTTPDTTNTPAQNMMPLPDDFEFDYSPQPETDPTVPVFTEINFDTTSSEAAADEPSPDTNDADNPIASFLKSQSIAFDVVDNIIITDKFAIASHTDTEYWVADTETWFAPGVQMPSPVVSAHRAATSRDLRPVLYLGASNIMDLDLKIQEWESMGVTVITSPDELLTL